MRAIKIILKIILIAVVAIVIFILALLGYVLIKNPYGLGDMLKVSVLKQEVKIDTKKSVNYDHPLLTAEQEQRITDAGIDIEKLPTEITPAQQQCGLDKLGVDRVQEILNGATPTSLEMIKVLPCLSQ